MGFCTVADIAAFLQINIAADSPAALHAIDRATATIKSFCSQQLEAVAGDVVSLTVEGHRQQEIVLPQFPVTAVSKVLEDGVELDAASYKWARGGILYRLNGHWPRGIQIVEVTYSHGYDPLPDDIIDVCVRAAARAYQAGLRASATDGVAGITGEQLADYQAQLATERATTNEWMLGASGAPILLRSEQEALSPFASSEIG